METPRLFMVFDVESVGLHGDGFSVGWQVVRREGGEVASACYAVDPDRCEGDEEGRAWIKANVPRPHVGYNCSSAREVRDEFWRAWAYAKKEGAVLAADCPWPVEARFLLACIEDDPEGRRGEGPYPLIDVASVRLAAGFDPLATVPRMPRELPVHNPMADARHAGTLLVEALAAIQMRGAST